MALAVAVVASCTVAFSQVSVNEPIDGTTITGTVTNVNPNTSLSLGTQITFVASTGITYTYAVVTVPSANPAGLLTTISNAIANAFNTNIVTGNVTPGVGTNSFGSNAGQFALQFVQQNQIPFDFGISAVLGAGALAAVRTARKRKAEKAEAIA